MRSRLLARSSRARDDGFTLIEAIVALGLAVIIFMALAFALIGGEHEVLLAQQNQQAGDVLNQAVEQARSLSYDALEMQTSDLTSASSLALDPLGASIAACAPAPCYNPTTDSLSPTTGREPLAVAAVGGLVPHATSVTQNGRSYTVRKYVTLPTDTTGATYKRLTVVVSWTSLGKSHSRIYSTFMSATKRGLPLPNYKFTPASGTGTAKCVNPLGNVVTYAFTVRNNGARDQWLISSTQSSPATPVTWSYYSDVNGNGVYDSATDTPMAAYTTGQPTTGLLEPNTQTTFLAVANTPNSAAIMTVTFTATSAAISTYSQSLTTTTAVQSGACTGNPTPSPTATPTATPTPTPTPTTTANTPPAQPTVCSGQIGSATPNLPNGNTAGGLVSYTLYNQGATSSSATNTVATNNGNIFKALPSVSSLYDYSTDLAAATAGRKVQANGASTATTAIWSYQFPGAATIVGSTGSNTNKTSVGEITMWALKTATTPVISVKLTVGSSTLVNTTFSNTGWTCAGMQQLQVGFTIPNDVAVASNASMTLTVTSTQDVYLGYGTSSFASEITLPVSGNA